MVSCCPTYVQVTLLAFLQALSLFTCVAMWIKSTNEEQRSAFIGCSTFTSCFLQPFVHVFMEPDNLRARLNLFFCDCVNWVLWFVVCHLIVLDLKGMGALLPDASIKVMIIDYMLIAYVIYFTSAALLLLPIWNFYVEKRDEGKKYHNNTKVKTQ